MIQVLGTHILLEFSGCAFALLDDLSGIEKALLSAAAAAETTVLESHFHRFEPQGVTGILLVSESHFSIHTWPELGYAAIDFFSCSPKTRFDAARHVLEQALAPRRVSHRIFERGPETTD
ncbi:MAG TPA: adenosylmethionine decarboxylase [Spirochaetota bacterium]|nr:adenosylmethionine decarboxylase [Spirochaetota bacterium]